MTITEILARICVLQPSYSSANTPAMQERGHLVRVDLAEQLCSRLPALAGAFDPVFDDLAVEGSDGIGRKTEAPWVRLYSRAMSPNPREGFYVVIHFAANGSAVFLTVGCGSTIWSGGDLRQIPDSELIARTSWARNVVLQRWGSTIPFGDEISLGAKAPLPRTFEKATVIARRIQVAELEQVDIEQLLHEAALRLNEIYLAQLDGRDVSPGDQGAEEIVAIAKPLKKGRSQGRGLTAAERKAVELRAMELATLGLTEDGYTCKDTSATESYDILASKGGLSLKVEVKGTTSDLCDSVLMTKNEVELHRMEKGMTGLVVVSGIRLVRTDNKVEAIGGEVEFLLGWDIDTWTAEPVAFQVRRNP